ncbi:MAG: GNAT family N-acetyltransferase [Lachnospirales bacterium]
MDNLNKKCFWAYYIGDTSYRGKGISKDLECNIYDYCFYTLNLNKLCCEVLSFNEKVISLHQKYGSLIEGEHKEHICKNNIFYDVTSMGITKTRWEEVRNSIDYNKISIE